MHQFAGEPTLEQEGNVYFTHRFTDGTKLFEADIHVLRRIPEGAQAKEFCGAK